MTCSPWTRWDPAKVLRYVRDWNDGLEHDALIEKYGIRRPAALAANLRKAGYQLAMRMGGHVPYTMPRP